MLKTYHITTFGCQSNLADSERIASVLENTGLIKTENKQKTDILVFNTCSVRQKAEDRIFGYKKEVEKLRNINRKLKIVLTGCMMHYSDKDLKRRLPFVDIFIDIKNISTLPKLLNIKNVRRRTSDIKNDYLNLEPKYTSKFSANIPISYGCNNFCTYCIVPYSRDREYSRPANDIINEVKKLIGKEYKELWLLGQNVNSYNDKGLKFPDLLRMINNIPGDFWIRFTSPHPKDFSIDTIKAMKESEKFAHYINLPAQSGDNKILKKMNRPYTANHYKKLVKKIRKAIPDIAISTDIIVGFPGETKDQFKNTKNLFKSIGFDMAFLSEYSPRPGTAAAMIMKDDVPHKEKEDRKNKLNNILAKTALKNNKKLKGKTVRVLIDRKDKGSFRGRTEGNKLVEIKPSAKIKVGEFRDVIITDIGPWKLKGEIK
ncbi:MAG: tRNA (N6-isopentenyl adenosine(37)-C2)-methylthiotransferase MiaB [Parcubacteria group bacterium]|nr:tRNA (N6-isopentenyl adenosine(37)-C2)-methylthiotransferase MiaB [Parcubacteria group bacterium]MCR4342988.1 tRNA (N6-isopentenyl adenosine(37)-C2)-methylthiotransferase MiaB [Patescibacteria group bacterium]